jgi:putative DNA primase/helicase
MHHDVERLLKLLENPLNGYGTEPNESEESTSDLSRALLDYSKMVTLEIPERKRHLAWLPEGSNVMVYGPRGVGKTMFELGLTAALTTGISFLKWPVLAPVGVLYVDGEMQFDELRTRMTALLPEEPRASLKFLASEYVYHSLKRDLVLTSEAVRGEIGDMLDANPDIRIVILDNVSCLFAGIDEDRKRDWEPIAAWLIRLRHRGLTTVLVHHAGKGGQQRGTSGREDALDTVILLERPPDYDPREGCHFYLQFTKSRSVKGDAVTPLDVKLEEHNGQLRWTHRTLEDSKLDQAKRLFKEGVTTPTDLAEEMNISKGYASKLLRKLKAEMGHE